MRNRVLLLFISIVFISSAQAQFKSFMWADSVDGEWPGFEEKVRTSIDTRVFFAGNFMYTTVCDFTGYWKCSWEISFMEYKQNSFQPVNKEDLFKDGGKELLVIANEKIQQCYKQGQGGLHDCFVGQDRPDNQTWSNISLGLSEEGMSLHYYFDSGTYCDFYNDCDTLISWEVVNGMLKNPIGSTPNFCTSSGPKVNVRWEESAKSEILFQLDKGQFFEILETGKKDKVNGKSGSWYKINFEGKTGYIFSFYTLCK